MKYIHKVAITKVLLIFFPGNALDDFKLVPKVELNVSPQTTLTNISLASCAEQCVLEEAYLCRSFNYYAVELRCTFYKENLVDQINTELKTIGNEFANLYSRLFYEKDGQVLEVAPLIRKEGKDPKSFSAGALFGVSLAMLIGGVLLGTMLAFVYLKITSTAKSPVTSLPPMKFTNPNYEDPQMEVIN